MVYLLFQLGQERYALDAHSVAEVLPMVAVTEISKAPAGVLGAFNYRGVPVPAIDLCRLTLGRPARAHLSTRIVVVHYPGDDGRAHVLGLVAEKATETLRREPADFVGSGVTSDQAPYLGPVTTDAHGIIQLIDAQRLLSPEIRAALFQTAAAS